MKWLTLLEELPCAEISRELVIEAAENSHNLGLSYWDGAIIAAAAQIGAFILYTEDLNHGQKYGSVTAINPFRTA